MCLGPEWLDGLLAAEGRGPMGSFFGPAAWETKFSQSVLPVFFGNAEACLTSRRGFETMGEMNPQVGKRGPGAGQGGRGPPETPHHSGRSVLPPAGARAEEGPHPRRARLYVTGSESLLTRVNRGDAASTVKVWIREVGKRLAIEFEARVDVLAAAGETAARLKERTIDLLVLDACDYLPLAAAGLVEPVATGSRRGRVGAFPYLLLAREAGPLAGLRGKRLIVCSRTKSGIGRMWTETLLAENGLDRAHRFFGSVKTTYQASSCVLPLFFGSAEACVVDGEGWELVKELNPQLGRLKILASSEPFLEGVIAMPVQPHPYRDEMVRGILDLHTTPAGGQLATVFRTGPLVRVGNGELESLRRLLERYRLIEGGAGRPGREVAPSAPSRRDQRAHVHPGEQERRGGGGEGVV